MEVPRQVRECVCEVCELMADRLSRRNPHLNTALVFVIISQKTAEINTCTEVHFRCVHITVTVTQTCSENVIFGKEQSTYSKVIFSQSTDSCVVAFGEVHLH